MKTRLIIALIILHNSTTIIIGQPTNQLLYDAYFNNSITGNIYFPVNFVDGKFSQWKGKEADGKLRFNLKLGKPEKLEGEKIIALSSITNSFSMKLDEKRTLNFRKDFKPVGSNDENTYYLILFDGIFKFISQLRVFETISSDYTNPGQMNYTSVINYFFVNEKGDLSKLNSKKSILKLPEIDKIKTKEFLEKNAVKLDEWTDVQKVIEFNVSLLTK